MRGAGIALRPTFVPFTPWATQGDYLDLLDFIAAERLVDHVDAVQLSIRLLVPPGSLLLARPEMQPFLGDLDPAGFTYRWQHPDPRMDELQREVSALVARGAQFGRVWSLATGRPFREPPPERPIPARLTEPWFC